MVTKDREADPAPTDTQDVEKGLVIKEKNNSGISAPTLEADGVSYEARLLEFIDMDDLPVRGSEFPDRTTVVFGAAEAMVITAKNYPRLAELAREKKRIKSLKGAMTRSLKRWIVKNGLDDRVFQVVKYKKIPEGDYPTKIRVYGYVITKEPMIILVPKAGDKWWNKAKKRMNERAFRHMGEAKVD